MTTESYTLHQQLVVERLERVEKGFEDLHNESIVNSERHKEIIHLLKKALDK